MLSWFMMGGYAIYVWSCIGLFCLSLGVLWGIAACLRARMQVRLCLWREKRLP